MLLIVLLQVQYKITNISEIILESKADDVSYDAGDLSLKVENIGTLDNDKFNTRRISFTSQELVKILTF